MSGFEPGTIINEKYEITSDIAPGGMATTYLAVDREKGRDVAIKALNFNQLSNTSLVLRFFQEFKILSSLSHPNI